MQSEYGMKPVLAEIVASGRILDKFPRRKSRMKQMCEILMLEGVLTLVSYEVGNFPSR